MMSDSHFIPTEHTYESDLEMRIAMLPKLISVLRGTLKPFPARLPTNTLSHLLRIYELVSIIPKSELHPDAEELWKMLVEEGYRIVEQNFKTNPEAASNAIFETLIAVSIHHKKESYLIEGIAQVLRNSSTENEKFLFMELQLYHSLYEGTYKELLSCYAYLAELRPPRKVQRSRSLRRRVVRDVDDSLQKLRDATFAKGAELFCNDVDPNIRHAFAHNHIELRNGRAYLKNHTWTADFDGTELRIFIQNLSLICYGMHAGLMVGFLRFEQEMAKHVRHRYHVEDIKFALTPIAKDYRFKLIDCSLTQAERISISLQEVPKETGLEQFSAPYGNISINVKTKLARPMNERATLLVKDFPLLWYGYKQVRITLCDSLGEQESMIDIDTDELTSFLNDT